MRGGGLSRVISTNISFAQVCGGPNALIGAFDARLATTGASFADAIGTQLGGAARMSPFVQATGGLQPTVANNRLVFGGTQSMAGPRDARLTLDGATPLHILVIGKFNNTGPVVGVANDPTNGALYPWAALQSAASVIKADFAPAAAGTGRIQPRSTVPVGDGKVRCVAIGKTSRYALSSATNEDWRFLVGGQQQQMFSGCSVATTVGGGLIPFLGNLFGAIGLSEVAWVGFLLADMDSPITQAFLQFGVNEHGAEMDTTEYGTIAGIGDSLGYGSQSSDPLSTVVGSGTTTSMYVASRQVSGPGNWLSPRKLAVTDMHSCIRYVSGRNPQNYLDRWDIDLGPLLDGCRAGKKVLWLRGILNGIQGLSWTTAQTLAILAEIKRKATATGWDELVLKREIDRTTGSNGAGNSRGLYLNPAADLTLAPTGTIITAVDAAIVASPTTYSTRLMNPGANAAFTMGTRAADNATNYFDGTHLTTAGYATKGALNKADFDGFNLWP